MLSLIKEDIEKIKKYPEVQDWNYISTVYKLSEDFIREFKEKVDWSAVSRKQELSENFLIEFIEAIDIFMLKWNKKIPQEVKDRIIAMKELM